MNNVYLIYGNDYSLIKREIDKISNTFLDVTYYDLSNVKVEELLDDASCISLFGDKKVLVGENSFFLTSTNDSLNHDLEYLKKYLDDNNHDNIVIFTVLKDKLDERKKIVKLLKQKSKVIYKEIINDKDMPSFVINEFKNEGYKIDYKTASYFIDYVGKNVDIILSEIRKMTIYKDFDEIISIDDINNISSKAFNDNVFDLSNAIMDRDFKKIISCYNDLMTVKEEPIKIISLLASQFDLVLKCKILGSKGKQNSDIAKTLGVHPFRVKLALETNYMMYELKDILKKLHDLDFGIKSGIIDRKKGLENFLLKL